MLKTRDAISQPFGLDAYGSPESCVQSRGDLRGLEESRCIDVDEGLGTFEASDCCEVPAEV